ncbi:MAG: N-acetylmuramoyl-L-alanine amidase [Anaerolineae bacterium]|nr:N-acetylmuramoyl-L-alanine amidase [Anaerolineae bacterium]
MKRQIALRVCVCLLLWPLLVTPGLAAPPPPDSGSQITATLREVLPSTWTLHSVQVAGDAITVCLDIPPVLLRAGDGLGAEAVSEAVRVALTAQNWHVLHLQNRDPLTRQCRALADFLPQTAPVNLNSPTPQGIPAVEPSSAINAPQSLSGKTVYISAGHGWYWGKDSSSSSPAQWLTQRGIYQGFIEDHNNAEVVTQYLIPYLENAGATVIPVRERDWNPQRSIADNDAGTPTYTEAGAWSAGAGTGYATGAYRVATSVTGLATASATWQLNAPQNGDYALYAWVVPDSNRITDAHYTIHHAAGASTVTLNQRNYPNTWRYLGTFPFYAGPITVTLDNSASVAGATLMADALRLGGGAFDNLTGIKTLAPQPPNKPWWETSTFYHAQWMGLNPDDWSYYNDVVARPIFARWNYARSGDGTGTSAVFISWHTNGYDGTARGTVSYVYNDAAGRTAGSVELQQAVHTELIHDIRAGWDAAWTDRGMREADLGEVRALWDDNPAARMPGTLLEIAFHDQVDDANALKDPRFEQLAARAVYQGILHYFEARDGVSLTELPEPPTHLRVENQGGDSVRVSWNASPTDSVGLVGEAATGYRLYTSPDGFAWSAPITMSGLSHTLTGLAPGQTLYVRVTGVNAGGESFPTEVLGARVGGPVLLIVNGFDRLTRYGLYVDDDTLVGPSQRLWLERLNRRTYVVHHGQATPAQYAWDSASNEAVYDGLVNLTDYPLVNWILGEESNSSDGTLNAAERAALGAFLADNRALLISGAELAWDLEALERDPDFLHQTLFTDYIADDADTHTVRPVAGGAFDGLPDFAFDAPGEYDTDYPDVIEPYSGSGATEALQYVGGTGGGAAVQFSQGCKRYLGLGFPLEVIRPESRDAVMASALDFLDACFQTETNLYLPLILRDYATETPRCTLILDSDFETEGDWTYNNLAVRATDIVYRGTYAARVGIPPGQPGQSIYSSISHTLTLPADGVSATLRLWAYPIAEELSEDYHYIILHDMEGESHVLSTYTSDDRAWQRRTFDLSNYIGQSVKLFIGTRNDGDDDTAALYLDDVQVELCR